MTRLRRSRHLVIASLVTAATLGGIGAVHAQDASHAPRTTSSNGGRTVSDGARALSVSQAAGLDPDGQTVSVSGVGYPVDKGVYVAFCVIPPTDRPPSPCGGGRGDQPGGGGGGDGASHWISSNPPVYATGMTTPYGPGGTFDTTLTISPAIADGLDCRQVRCAVATRADHTRSSDRSLDLLVPVGFADGTSAGVTPTTAPPPAPTVPTTIAALAASQVAPVGAVTDDGRSVAGGGRSLSASHVTGLDPGGAAVSVEGAGFDTDRGIYVALCAVPAPDPRLPAGASPAPGPCTAGAEGAAAWISSNPPGYGRGLATAHGPGGSFRTELRLRASIDEGHDCRVVACAIVSRSDDTNPSDRTQDLYLPVAFAAAPAPSSSATTVAAPGSADEDGPTGRDGRSGPLTGFAVGAGVLVLGVLATATVRRRGTR